jgi:hypothetical protein
MSRNSIFTGAVCALVLFTCGQANAQGVRLKQWLRGEPGLFAPDYVTPSEDIPGYVTGGPSSAPSSRHGKLIFAAATVDQRCQQDGSPRVSVLASPRAVRVKVDLGGFVATGIDGGSAYCLGRPVRGTRVFYVGRQAHGEQIVLRVAYPHKGLTYDHVITVP